MIYTTTAKETNMGNLWNYKNEEEFCMAIYVRMCSSCQMELKFYVARENFAEVGNDFEELDNKIITFDKEIWKEHIFKVDIRSYRGLNKILTIRTIGMDPDRFWAIGEVRSCSTNGWFLN